jgi:hypothetical protein
MDFALDRPAATAVDAAAAAALAGAIAFAGSMLAGWTAMPLALLGFAATFAILRQVQDGTESYFLPGFEPADLPNHSQELVLTEEMIIERPAAGPGEELVLDDVLAEIEPDSRVVRLFDPRQMPTPGELRANIDRHLRPDRSAANPDATQALSEALAELRRSLH